MEQCKPYCLPLWNAETPPEDLLCNLTFFLLQLFSPAYVAPHSAPTYLLSNNPRVIYTLAKIDTFCRTWNVELSTAPKSSALHINGLSVLEGLDFLCWTIVDILRYTPKLSLLGASSQTHPKGETNVWFGYNKLGSVLVVEGASFSLYYYSTTIQFKLFHADLAQESTFLFNFQLWHCILFVFLSLFSRERQMQPLNSSTRSVFIYGKYNSLGPWLWSSLMTMRTDLSDLCIPTLSSLHSRDAYTELHLWRLCTAFFNRPFDSSFVTTMRYETSSYRQLHTSQN